MNWNAIGAIAELVAAAGVVVTLLYLAVQVRQNTKALRAATFQNIIGFATGFAERVAGSGEFAAIFETGMADLEALDESERLRFHFQLIALLRRFENIHYQSRMGLIDDEEWEGLRAALHSIMFRPGSRAWWKGNAHLFNSSFREFLDGRLAANDAQGASVMSPERVAANARETT
ncbi:MAG TPA: hypothetical protein VFZ04_19740 [Longimicrobiales bacterium]